MKEARPHRAVGFDHHRHPRARCTRRAETAVARERRVVLRQPAQLVGRLGDEARRRSRRGGPRSSASTDARELGDLVACRARAATLRRRRFSAERGRRHIGRQKRNAVERHRLGVLDQPRQLAEIRAMQRRARRDRHVRREPPQPRDAALDRRQRVDAADRLIERVRSAASSETITREKCAATSVARTARAARRSSAGAASCRLPRNSAAASNTSGRSSGSPPENATTRVPSAGSASATASISVEREIVGAAALPPVARDTAAVAPAGRIEDQQRQHERAIRHLAQADEQRRGQRRSSRSVVMMVSAGRIHSAIAFSMGNA